MKLILLGSSGYHPNDNRQTACLMLPDVGVLLDAGTAMYRVRDHLITDQLDIFVTHAHLDHVIGLTYLFDVTFGREMQRVTVHGQPAKLEAIDRHLFAELLFPVRPPLSYRPLTEEVALPRDGRLSYFELTHPGGAVGFRLDWPGRSMAYVTDTTASHDASYVAKIRGVDLLIHECYFADDHSEQALLTGHSCVTPVAQLAAAANIGRLVMVHINPLATAEDPVGLSIARTIFPNSDLGEDNMELEF